LPAEFVLSQIPSDREVNLSALAMDTIAAIATPFGSAGIGIVRISGDHAKSILQKLFLPKPECRPQSNSAASSLEFLSHRLTHGFIYDPISSRILDEVLAVLMAAPNSYTREDVVEIQSHSGFLLLQKILSLVLQHGARLAEPGEFTRRAFLNGRIDLSQAEAVIDMINARSEQALFLASSQLQGWMKHQVTGLVERLTAICVDLQANIEFPDEIDCQDEIDNYGAAIQKDLIEPIGKLLNNYHSAHVFRDGVRFSIVGRPNVGKSSLLNRLLESSKAIVTPYPGTTRDPVEGFTQIKGIPILFADTAGLRPSDDPIEQIGMQKTRECIEQADFVFFVLQADQSVSKEDREIYQQVRHKNVVLLINKIDLVSAIPHWPAAEFPNLPIVQVSALTGEGLSDLKDAVVSALSAAPVSSAHESVPTLRQKQALEAALDYLSSAVQAIGLGTPDDLVLQDLEAANAQLNTILGQTASIDLLDEIFSRFCIGK